MGKTLGANAFAEVSDGGRVAEKVLEAHELSLEHLRNGVERRDAGIQKRELE
jgi:hypothetical protein